MITLFALFCILLLLVVIVLAGLLSVLWPVLLIIFAIWIVGRMLAWLL